MRNPVSKTVLDQRHNQDTHRVLEFMSILTLASREQFTPFEKRDWSNYAGCESKEPLICHLDDCDVIIDGKNIQVVYLNEDSAEMTVISADVDRIV